LFLTGAQKKNDITKAFERLAKFMYLGMTIMSAGCSREDIERKINSGNFLANFNTYIIKAFYLPTDAQ